MDPRFLNLTSEMAMREGVSEPALADFLKATRVRIPPDYLEFMRMTNGAEGSVGTANYLILWPIEEIYSLNSAYHTEDFIPGCLLFGTDGANTAYAFDGRSEATRIIALPFVPMELAEALDCGSTFVEFLEFLAENQ